MGVHSITTIINTGYFCKIGHRKNGLGLNLDIANQTFPII